MANEALTRMERSLLDRIMDLDRIADPSPAGASAREREYVSEFPYRRAPAPAEEPVTLDRIAGFMELDLRRILVWLREGVKLTLAVAIMGAVAAFAWGQLVPRTYTVTTDILVDPASFQVINNDPFASASESNVPLFSFGSKVRILTSGNVMMRAVKELELASDPEFYRPSSGLGSFFGRNARGEVDRNTAALATLQKQVSIVTDENSFIASLRVSAQTAGKAIEISKALVDAFQEELATADAQNAARTALALTNRLDDLKRDVLDADARVEDYKRANKLSIGDNGRLVSAQTLSQLNTEIIAARSRAINAQASYEELRKAGNSLLGGQAAVSPALTVLLQSAGLLQQQYDDQAAILGARHPSIVRLKARLASVQQQVEAELERARSAAKAELDKANATLTELSSKMLDLEDSTFDDSQSQVELRELERDVAAKTAVYESFLSRAGQITEREQINTNNIRVISDALPPPSRSWPPGSIVLLILGGLAGLVLGIGLSVMRGIVLDMRPAAGAARQAS